MRRRKSDDSGELGVIEPGQRSRQGRCTCPCEVMFAWVCPCPWLYLQISDIRKQTANNKRGERQTIAHAIRLGESEGFSEGLSVTSQVFHFYCKFISRETLAELHFQPQRATAANRSDWASFFDEHMLAGFDWEKGKHTDLGLALLDRLTLKSDDWQTMRLGVCLW